MNGEHETPYATIDDFIDHLRKDADAAFPYDVDYMNVVNGIAGELEVVWEREQEKIAGLKEALEKIAHYCDDPYNMDDPCVADGHILSGIAKEALGIDTQSGGGDGK